MDMALAALVGAMAVMPVATASTYQLVATAGPAQTQAAIVIYQDVTGVGLGAAVARIALLS